MEPSTHAILAGHELRFNPGILTERQFIQRIQQACESYHDEKAAQLITNFNTERNELEDMNSFYKAENENLKERAEKAETKCHEMKVFLNALRLSHDLDVPEEVWKELLKTP